MQRFWDKVAVGGPDECWLWTAQTSKGGYGKFKFSWERGHVTSHRMVWEFIRGAPLPPGQWVLHRCHVPACVNPRHLYLGTAADNARDRERAGHGFKPRKKCKHGHEWTDENTYITYPASHGGRPFRQCRTCMNRRQREYEKRKRAAAA